MQKLKTTFKALTIDSWNDFERLFGERGACGGCWCMYWRLRNKDFENQLRAKITQKFIQKGF